MFLGASRSKGGKELRSYFKQLSRDTLIYGVSGALSKMVGLLVLPVLTRALSPQDYGTIDILTTVQNFFMTFIVLGMNASMVSFFYDANTDAAKKEVVRTNFSFMVFWGLCLAVVGALTGQAIIGRILGAGVPFRWVITLAIIAFLGAVRDNLFNLARILFKSWLYLIASVGGVAVTYFLILWLIIQFQQGVGGYLTGVLVGTAFAATTSSIFLKDYVRGAFSSRLLSKMLIFALPLVPTDIALWAIRFAERFFILHYSSAEDLGIYAVGVRVSSIVLLVVFAIQQAWAPLALSIQNRPDSNSFYVLFDCVYKVGMSVFVIVLTAISLPLLMVLTPPVYHTAYRVVGFAAYGAFFSSIYWVSGLGVVLGKKSAYMTVAIVASSILSVGLYYILVPLYGTMGAAAGGAIAHVIGNMIVLFYGERTYTIGFGNKVTILVAGWTFLAITAEVAVLGARPLPISLVYCALIIVASCLYLFYVGIGSTRLRQVVDQLRAIRA